MEETDLATNTTDMYDALPRFEEEAPADETEEERKKREEEERILAEQARLKEIQAQADARKVLEESSARKEAIVNMEEEILVPEKNTSFSNMYDSLPEEDEDDDVDYSQLDEDISTTRQIQYGGRQEKTIAGNLLQLTTAFFTRKEGETFKQAARRLEDDRQQEIFKDYPEFRGKTETWTVVSGRMGVAIADPVTLLVPWTKIAKAGKLVSVATGGSVAASDMALREYTLYGDVTAKNVALGFGLGGLSSGVSAVISNRLLKSSGADDIVTENLDDATKLSLKEAGEETALEVQPVLQSWSDNVSNAGMKYTQRDILFAEIQKVKDAINKITTPKRDPKQTSMPLGLDGSIKPTPTLSIKEASKVKLQRELRDLELQVPVLQKEIDELIFIKMPEDAAIIGFSSLKNIWNKTDDKGVKLLEGKYGKSLIRALVQETVRPMVGAAGGSLVALGFSDGSDDSSLTKAMMTGALLGFFQKRIQISKFKLDVKTIEKINGEFQKEFSLHWMVHAKKLFSGTQATHFQANNYVMQSFGNSMFKSQGLGVPIGKPLPDAIETLSAASEDLFRSKLFKITGTATDEEVAAATRIIQERNMPSTSKHSFLDEGDLDNVTAQKMADDVIALQEEFKQYVRQTGLFFDDEASYGLTQIFNPQAAEIMGVKDTLEMLKEAFRIQNVNANKLNPDKYKLLKDTSNRDGGKTIDEKLEALAKNYLEKSDMIRRKEIISSERLIKGTQSLLDNNGNPLKQDGTLIQSARFFDNERTLFDQEARAYAKNLFIQDFEYTTNSLFQNTIPVVEFARRYGAKGQGLADTIKQLKQFYQDASIKAGGTGDFMLDKGLRKLYNNDIKSITSGVNSFFGVHDISKQVSDGWSKSVVMTLQALLSTTKLTKVVIPSMGDLIQVFQNSGPKAAMSSLMVQMRQSGQNAVKPSAALGIRSGRIKEGVFGRADGDITFGLTEKILNTQFKNRRYNGTLHKELSQFSMTATSPYQQSVQEFQKRFFEIVQLGRITRFAREFAFDAGAIRAFELGQRKSFRTRHLRELTDYKISPKDAKYLQRFKNIDEAMDDSFGKMLLERAGRHAADRDALIPTAGNRRLFSQSNDPWLRFMGSFLSWAQAKSAQTNALVGKIEEGDAKLAAYMTASLGVYGSIKQLQVLMNPDEKVRELATINPFEDIDQFKKFIGDGGMFSGQFYPWWIDKPISSYKYNQYNVAESVYPAYSIIDDFVKATAKGVKGDSSVPLFMLESAETFIPGAKEITRRPVFGKPFGYEESISEQLKADVKSKGKRPNFSIGGRVGYAENAGLVSKDFPVQFALENPSDRINEITGLPYNFQRVQYNKGKIVDPRYEGAKALLRQTHKYAVDNEAYGDDGSGGKVSFHSGVIGKGPKEHYIVNGYNPTTKQFETDEEIFRRIEPLIKSGQLKPYEDPKIADTERAKMRNEILQETGDK